MPDNILTPDEASEYLKISKHTLYVWVSRRQIRHIKVGNKYLRFRIEDLEDFLKEHEVSDT